ncbi:MAG TPA: sugar ABC transporter permease [Tepidisphaeraceae bacterium]|nr:sugar ABC transporter permease [Tepidisphaeraceae bacterium]
MSRRKTRSHSGNRWRVGLAFCLPLIIGLTGLMAFPVLASFYFSLTSYPIFDPPRWIGLTNYGEMLQSPRFWLSVWNTAYYATFAVPLGIMVGLLLALLLNLKVRGQAFFRTMFFLPTIVPLIATCVLWSQILNPDHGLINESLRLIGIPDQWLPGWLSNELWSKPALILMSLWGCGGGMVLYLAALQDVPMELYESAAIDGARAWHRLWNITLPMISPIILFNLIMGLIGSIQYFTQAYVMTQGGPWDSTNFYALELFNNAFGEYRLGYASAMAWVMFAVILTLTLVVMKVSNRFVYYHS